MENKLGGNHKVFPCLQNLVQHFLNNFEVRLTDIIEMCVPCLEEHLFTLHKDYKLVEITEGSNGKWPSSMGNGFFIDQQFLLEDLYGSLMTNVLESGKESKNFDKISDVVTDLHTLFTKFYGEHHANHMAGVVLGKIIDRPDVFL